MTHQYGHKYLKKFQIFFKTLINCEIQLQLICFKQLKKLFRNYFETLSSGELGLAKIAFSILPA